MDRRKVTPLQHHNPPGSPKRRATRADWVGLYLRHTWAALRPLPKMPQDHELSHDAAWRGVETLGGADGITWLGQATFLARLGGLRVLTDPFLSDRATGWPPFGPKRYAGPGLTMAQLPPIDLLLASHNHYDHLDEPTLAALKERGKTTVVAPLGLGDFFRARGFVKVHELQWHEQMTIGKVTVTAMPAVHNSGRGVSDRNHSLWCGYSVRTPDTHLYFSGDTAYGPVFAEVGERYGPFDVGLVPIGAYQPRVLFSSAHVTPEEAVQIGHDLQVRRLIAMHWGTIKLTDEPIAEPPGRFLAAGRAVGYADADLVVLKIGETFRI